MPRIPKDMTYCFLFIFIRFEKFGGAARTRRKGEVPMFKEPLTL